MATWDKENMWDCEKADVFVGPGDGTNQGFLGDVTITKKQSYHSVKAQQTGDQELDRRSIAEMYDIAIDFRERGDATIFREFWLDQRAAEGDGTTKLHPGTLGGSLPTRQVRAHPRSLGADESKDWTFTHAVLNGDISETYNGTGEFVYRVSLTTLPDPTQLPTIDIGDSGHVSA